VGECHGISAATEAVISANRWPKVDIFEMGNTANQTPEELLTTDHPGVPEERSNMSATDGQLSFGGAE
jgi:hypothetical protein